MSNLTIFVPEYIDLNSIDKCFWDSKTKFVNINSSDFDAAAKIKELEKFIVLEKDHLVIYLAPPAHNQQSGMASFKCSYSIRNWVMNMVRYDHNLHQRFNVGYNGTITEVDGILNINQPPVLYFVCRDNAHCLASFNSTVFHAIVEYFEDDDGIDFAKLGEIAKTKTCVPHFFVVNKAADYYAVDTNDTNIRYKSSANITDRIVTEMASGRRTIEDCYEEDRKIAERLSAMRFNPDFQLRDREGVPLGEGCLFSLQIVDDYDDEYYEDDDDEEYERELNWGRRCGGCGGWGCGLCGGVGLGGWNGGWNGGFVGGGWGFPFASNAVNQFDRNTNCAQCVDNTFFTNNRAANVANDNVHCCNSANIIA
ncbi:hypothetical protein GGI07_003077 [Coemansia sp. Benny D115]|nr:hypothetical protein GGI07_003077 [Coemansia sp. Benny D115]